VVLHAATRDDADALGVSLQHAIGDTRQQDKAQGSVFVLREHGLDERLLAGLKTAACIVLDGRDGLLEAQLAERLDTAVSEVPRVRSVHARGGKPSSMPSRKDLQFWNGCGGFMPDGREYVTLLDDGGHTPAPWAHVVANPDFGFLVTATGGGYCWAVNSQQNQITPWSNDAARDPVGEAFLLRDADDGIEWSATASPVRAGGATYVARFGPGYARFDANVHGIESALVQCVAASDPVKISCLRSGRSERILVQPRRLNPIAPAARCWPAMRGARNLRARWRSSRAMPMVPRPAVTTTGAAPSSRA